MARMKDFKDKLNTIKDKFKTDKSDDQSLTLPYNTSLILNSIAATKDLCTEMRRVGSYGIVTSNINEDDKKPKKKSLTALSTLFSETSTKFQDTDPMRGPLNYSAKILGTINSITKDFEKNLELQVIDPMANIEMECIEIQDIRKKLHDLRRESLSLNDKLTRMLDQSNCDEQKCNTLRDQIEDLKMECDTVSDVYLQKVLQFEASNFEHAQAIHDMVLLRTEYHDKCAKELLKIIPEANKFMEERRTPYSYGYPLENHLREIKKCIAYPIEKCVTALSNTESLREEGLFRVSGVKSKSNLLCSALNIMRFDQITCKWPPHVLADALKRYLREMPVPLMGKVSTSDWDMCYEMSKLGQKDAAYSQMKNLVNAMPKSYFNNLEYLIRFLNKVVQEKVYNLMNIQNICTVFTPNLFRNSNSTKADLGMNMDMSTSSSFVLEALLSDTNYFFPSGNQSLITTKVKSKKKAAPRVKPNVLDLEPNSITFRPNLDESIGSPSHKHEPDEKLQRRRIRCLESNIFNSPDSAASPQISSPGSITSISSETTSTESPMPVPPPRKSKNG